MTPSILCIDELGSHAGVVKTGSGGYVIPATIARVGIYNYVLDGKPTRVLRTEEDVFAPESLATLARCPVTVYHPGEDEVTTDNYRRVNVGFLENPSRQGRFIKAGLCIQDSQTLRDIDRPAHDPQKLCEVSAGYRMQFALKPGAMRVPEGAAQPVGDYESGVHSVFGPYDRRHTNIAYNHVSLGPKGWGRAGADVGIQLDSVGARYIRGMSNLLVTDAADPVVAPVAPAPVAPAVVAPAVVDAAQYAPRADLDRANARADVLETTVSELRAQLAAKPAPAPVTDAAQVAARATLVTDAKVLAPGLVVTDSMTDHQVRKDALVASGFTPKFDTADYIGMAFDVRVENRKVVVDSHEHAVRVIATQTVEAPVTDANDPLLAAQAKSMKRSLGLA